MASTLIGHRPALSNLMCLSCTEMVPKAWRNSRFQPNLSSQQTKNYLDLPICPIPIMIRLSLCMDTLRYFKKVREGHNSWPDPMKRTQPSPCMNALTPQGNPSTALSSFASSYITHDKFEKSRLRACRRWLELPVIEKSWCSYHTGKSAVGYTLNGG